MAESIVIILFAGGISGDSLVTNDEEVKAATTPVPTAKPTPTPYRRSTGKSSGKSSGYSTGPDASGYYDPDDFYYDYYDDFIDFEDAEEYYYSHGGW